MATWGKCDFNELKQFEKRLLLLEQMEIEAFCKEAARELAARLLAKVIKRTPVGDYSGDVKKYKRSNSKKGQLKGATMLTKTGKIRHEKFKSVSFSAKGKAVSFKADVSGKKGGTLRRGWTAKTQDEAASGGTPNPTTYAQSLKVTKSGNVYQIEVVNPVDYSSYVEFGHRTRGHTGWVQGRFMLTISEAEIQTIAAAVLEKKMKKYLGECFNGK